MVKEYFWKTSLEKRENNCNATCSQSHLKTCSYLFLFSHMTTLPLSFSKFSPKFLFWHWWFSLQQCVLIESQMKTEELWHGTLILEFGLMKGYLGYHWTANVLLSLHEVLRFRKPSYFSQIKPKSWKHFPGNSKEEFKNSKYMMPPTHGGEIDFYHCYLAGGR